MPATSKKRQISKIWHKNMPVGNTVPKCDGHMGKRVD